MVSSLGKTYNQARSTSFGKWSVYQIVYQRYGYIIFVYGVPFLVLILVNIGIILKIVETTKRKSILLGVKNRHSSNSCVQMRVKQQSELVSQTKSLNKEKSSTDHACENSRSKGETKPEYRSTAKRASIIGGVTLGLDSKITFMVLAVVLAFVCCQLPYLVLHVLAPKHFSAKWFDKYYEINLLSFCYVHVIFHDFTVR